MNISGVETVCHIAVGERELTQGFYGGVRSRVARRRNLCLSLIYMQPYLPRNAWKAEADSITTETLLTTHLPVNQLCRRGHCCVARCGGGNANWRDAATGDSTPTTAGTVDRLRWAYGLVQAAFQRTNAAGDGTLVAPSQWLGDIGSQFHATRPDAKVALAQAAISNHQQEASK